MQTAKLYVKETLDFLQGLMRASEMLTVSFPDPEE
jgi:hypothetical protein